MAHATLIIDGHVHLYSVFDLNKAIELGTEKLLKISSKFLKSNSDAVPAWLLVERSDTNYFQKLSESLNEYEKNGFNFRLKDDKLTILVEKNDKPFLYIFAGRQLVSKENLEVLSLISDLNIPDKQKTITDLIESVKKSGGIATLNWAPGKWFFSRGKVIAQCIEKNTPEDFFIGETTLRNTLWPEPKLIKHAKNKGFTVIAGSDPLPFSGEENSVGSFGFLVEGEFDANRPAESFRNIIKSNRKSIRLIGRRNDPFTFAVRQYKIMQEKKTRNS